ncbi:28S ribosomal protein S9, mitochondrial-like isoform X1 [Orbicella faveolata]|uniref:28S ribosomal protein S9, mitochondrial-like isoform X1 n=1 Tax=Orbicella faveolata TaxID=48498 RepID=UPI0009E21609|nr:28S ribosomal protein S9, mitochondrial-like isoform X1 [Orbicella faveolata]
MASGIRCGARLFLRVSSSSCCLSRTSRLTTNTSRYLWRCRPASAVNAVSPKRFYADEKSSRFSEAFSFSRINESLKPENSVNAEANTDSTSSDSLEEGQDDDDPLAQQVLHYKKHCDWLAKIMGKDPESFSSQELQEAIEYLMPSGLYAKDCRPLLEDPRKIYRQTVGYAKAMDKNGRPLASAFYSGQVGFHDTLFEIYEQAAKLDASDGDRFLEAVQTSKSETGGEELDIDDSESVEVKSQPKMRWITKEELQRDLNELLPDKDYEVIVHRLKKLAKHRNALLATPFLLRFLREIPLPGMEDVEKKLNEKGEAFGEGERKRAIAKVTVKRGSGNVTVNDVPFTKYFGRMEDRKQIMCPFLTVGAVGEYDVKSEVIGGGHSGQAGAIRLAISRALLNFEDSYLEPLQKARLLIRDYRVRERKKPGQKRARKKFAWVRR